MNKKVVLVTGSSSGLGKSIIKEYAKNNYDVVITYLNNEKSAYELLNSLKEEYKTDGICVKCDLKSEDDINNLYNAVINKFNKLDVLVNNASISSDCIFESKTKEKFMEILQVNTVGTFLVSKIFGKLMYDNKFGRIINISSNNAIDSYYEYSLDYDASKAALNNLTHNLANHFAPYVNVNCVCPGWIETSMNDNMDQQFKENEKDKILLKRFAIADEIAHLVYFLSSDKANYINDSIVKIDGGKKC